MTRRKIAYAAGWILLAFCAALAVLPARWAMAVLPQNWPLAVVDASGTVWSGNAIIGVGTPERRRSLPEPLRWDVSFSGGPNLTLSHPWLGGPLILRPGWLGVGVSGQTLQLPASALGALDARVEAIGPGGELSFKWPASVIGPTHRPTGTLLLEATWHNSMSALTPIRPLGDYVLGLKQAEHGRIDLVLSTDQGPLILNGIGVLDARKGFQFNGTAQTDPAARDDIHVALSDVLAALGPRKNNQTILRFR